MTDLSDLRSAIGETVAERVRVTQQEGEALTNRYWDQVVTRLELGQATVYQLATVVVSEFRQEARSQYGELPTPQHPVKVTVFLNEGKAAVEVS